MSKRVQEVSFECSSADRSTIGKIVERAKRLDLIGRNYSGLSCTMDVTAAHCNGNPLRLEDLLKADDFNFMHDVCGIARHLNRDTGKLENFFSPRFSARG
jgi:hypothetical protein